MDGRGTGSVARQKADILRLRGEEGKIIKEWKRRDERIAEPDHENTNLSCVSLCRRLWKHRSDRLDRCKNC